VQVIGWNLAAVSNEAEKAAEMLWKELEGLRACLDEECTGDEVEQEAEWCQISKMHFSHWKPAGVSERMLSVKLDVSISGEYQTLGGQSCRPSE